MIDHHLIINCYRDAIKILLSRCISADKTRPAKPKILSYTEADRIHQEKLDTARQAYGNVLNTNIKVRIVAWFIAESGFLKQFCGDYYTHIRVHVVVFHTKCC